jgi:hypothetical protein
MPTVRNILLYGAKQADTLSVENVSDSCAKCIIVLGFCRPTDRRTYVITSVACLIKGSFE